MKLPSVVFIRLRLNRVKIAQTVAKVGVHASLSNGHPNLCSNLISKKLVKSETLLCVFARVAFKRSLNSSKHGRSWSACLSTK